MSWAITAVAASEAASVTAAIAAATATIAGALAGRDGDTRLGLAEAVGGSFAPFGELFVDDVFFGVGLVEVFVVFFGVIEIADSGIVDGILFFEVVLIEVFFVGPSPVPEPVM